jgi:acid stress-induced BolA-like protein IbaG/YrbA
MLTMNIEQQIKHCLSTDLNPYYLQVVSPDQVHFEAVIVSDAFIGQTRLQAQQLVYKSLDSLLKSGALHAISFKTYTIDTWNQMNQTQ